MILRIATHYAVYYFLYETVQRIERSAFRLDIISDHKTEITISSIDSIKLISTIDMLNEIEGVKSNEP